MTLDFLRPYRVNTKIRAGKLKDGGYVIEENSLNSIEVIYSYGVGWDISFEKALLQKVNKTCRIFDPTIGLSSFSNHTYIRNKGYYYLFKYFVATALWKPYIYLHKAMGYKFKFYSEGLANKKENHYDSFQNHIIRFKDSNKNIFLKIDIDGGEYEIFKDINFIASLNNVVQLAVEFHNVKERFSELENIIESISDRLSLIHIHGNNWGGTFEYSGKQIPYVLELTFIANNFLAKKQFDTADYPIAGLDFPNKPSLPDIDLCQFTSRY
jgi:hypothetical protein